MNLSPSISGMIDKVKHLVEINSVNIINYES